MNHYVSIPEDLSVLADALVSDATRIRNAVSNFGSLATPGAVEQALLAAIRMKVDATKATKRLRFLDMMKKREDKAAAKAAEKYRRAEEKAAEAAATDAGARQMSAALADQVAA